MNWLAEHALNGAKDHLTKFRRLTAGGSREGAKIILELHFVT